MTAARNRAELAALPAPLPAADLRWECAPLRPSQQQPALTHLLGQERAVEALRTGLELRAPGYHVFLSGPSDTGRSALVQEMIASLEAPAGPGPDRIYLSNLRELHRPRLLTLAPGRAPVFEREFRELIDSIREVLRAAVHSRAHKMSRRLVLGNAEARQRRLFDALARVAERAGCQLVPFEGEGGVGADIYPVCHGEAASPEALAGLVAEGRLTPAERDELLARRAALVERLEEVYDRVRRVHRDTERELREMDQKLASRQLQHLIGEFVSAWPQAEVQRHLDEIRDWIELDLTPWVAGDHDQASEQPPMDPRQELVVHVVRTSEPAAPRPMVFETHPTWPMLFGALEPARDGIGSPSAMHPGALLRADGGFLVLRAVDVLNEPGVWAELKRTLRSGELQIREHDPNTGATTGPLQPEVIPVDVKVVLIGEPGAYEALAAEDPQFLQTFKVHAELDTTVPATTDNCRRYADLLAWLSRHEGLRAFAPEAAAAVVEFGARRGGRRDRLTTSFGEIADIGREASLWCERSGGGPVRREHVQAALEARDRRLDLAREQVERDMRDGYLLVSTTGFAVGQVNALTVIDVGTFAFGKPCRITATTGASDAGRTGVVNIERESDLSGPLHDKGVFILSGFLLDRYGRDGPLSVRATLCLEQSYGGVDGDSASGAELLALLSSLSHVPLDQGMGVTGSVNQKGEIQAVHGVNEKVEGHFRLCCAQGLSGDQGVVLPRANVPDLMLSPDIVAAVRDKRFSVYAVDTVEQALVILTRRRAEEVLHGAGETLARFRAGC
ncbi:MAG: ATP-binding protein [Planctomycetota bacterium]